MRDKRTPKDVCEEAKLDPVHCMSLGETNATTAGTPFSYAVPGQQNEIVILGVRNPSIYIAGGSSRYILLVKTMK